MAEEGFFGAIGRIASTVMGGVPDGPRYAWNAFAPWFQQLSAAATTRWLPVLVQGVHCQVVLRDPKGIVTECPMSAIAACVVCQSPVCLEHSFVSKAGDALCYRCVTQTIHEHRTGAPPPPPGTQGAGAGPQAAPPPSVAVQLARARKLLGVRKSASSDDVRSAFRKLAARWHPDKHPNAPDAAREKFIEITAARDLLLKHIESKP